jgi:hypothetical protein
MCRISLAGLMLALAARGTLAQSHAQEPSAPQTQPVEETGRGGWAIQTEHQAIGKAREIVGLPDRSPARLSAQLVTLAEDNTPFLHHRIAGRPIWQVVIKDWRLQLKSAPAGEEDQYSRVFDVFIDPTNGHLLKAISRWPQGVPPIAPEPSARSAEDQMSRSDSETYVAFPDAPPRVDLLRALDMLREHGVAEPLAARQIVAHYVLRSTMGAKPRPVWAITLRGIPPIKTPPPGVSIDALNHIRVILDAETGKWLCATTTPQPETGAPPGTGEGAEQP